MKKFSIAEARLIYMGVESGSPEPTEAPKKKGPESSAEVTEGAQKESTNKVKAAGRVARERTGASPQKTAEISAKVGTMTPEKMDEYVDRVMKEGPKNAAEALTVIILYMLRKLNGSSDTGNGGGVDSSIQIDSGPNRVPEVLQQFRRLDAKADLKFDDTTKEPLVVPTDGFVNGLDPAMRARVITERTIDGKKTNVINPKLTPTEAARIIQEIQSRPTPIGTPTGGPTGGPTGAPTGGPSGGPAGGPVGPTGPTGAPTGGPSGGPAAGPTEVNANAEQTDKLVGQFDRQLDEFRNVQDPSHFDRNVIARARDAIQAELKLPNLDAGRRETLNISITQIIKVTRNLNAWDKKQESDRLSRRLAEVRGNAANNNGDSAEYKRAIGEIIAANKAEILALQATQDTGAEPISMYIKVSRDQRLSDLQTAIGRYEHENNDPNKFRREREGSKLLEDLGANRTVTPRSGIYEISHVGVGGNDYVRFNEENGKWEHTQEPTFGRTPPYKVIDDSAQGRATDITAMLKKMARLNRNQF